MYLGEVVISTDMLEEFMSTAKSLQIRGLTKSDTSEQNKRKQSTSTLESTKRTKYEEPLLVQNAEIIPSISTVEEILEVPLIPECNMDQEIKIEYVELESSSSATPDFFCEGMEILIIFFKSLSKEISFFRFDQQFYGQQHHK